MSKNINFAVKISLLRRQEFFDFSVDFCDNFGPPKSQRVKKWKSYVINSQIVSKHIPYDLDISSKVKQRVLGTIEIWRKCPSTEALCPPLPSKKRHIQRCPKILTTDPKELVKVISPCQFLGHHKITTTNPLPRYSNVFFGNCFCKVVHRADIYLSHIVSFGAKSV